MIIKIKIKDGDNLNEFKELCKEMKCNIGISPLDYLSTDTNFKDPVLFNTSEKMTNEWIERLKKFE